MYTQVWGTTTLDAYVKHILTVPILSAHIPFLGGHSDHGLASIGMAMIPFIYIPIGSLALGTIFRFATAFSHEVQLDISLYTYIPLLRDIIGAGDSSHAILH
ncbi:hypothetical protein BDQ12DRAFT_35516 [Crucibulum laeve]|uniref:Uncharacterized protein n=1 Tax=Crucibulum laeve TaxID=68775 RepID=A0A5C3MLG5_9AGAR|nr:hypothetical protein BDQ12DRAFT_35516 [Crucibulum laeve]